jgi:hypothetical protein
MGCGCANLREGFLASLNPGNWIGHYHPHFLIPIEFHTVFAFCQKYGIIEMNSMWSYGETKQ